MWQTCPSPSKKSLEVLEECVKDLFRLRLGIPCDRLFLKEALSTCPPGEPPAAPHILFKECFVMSLRVRLSTRIFIPLLATALAVLFVLAGLAFDRSGNLEAAEPAPNGPAVASVAPAAPPSAPVAAPATPVAPSPAPAVAPAAPAAQRLPLPRQPRQPRRQLRLPVPRLRPRKPRRQLRPKPKKRRRGRRARRERKAPRHPNGNRPPRPEKSPLPASTTPARTPNLPNSTAGR